MMKKELPGRTLDFTFDLSATPVIGRRGSMDNKATDNCNRLAAANSIDMSISSWKKPHLSQVGNEAIVRFEVFSFAGFPLGPLTALSLVVLLFIFSRFKYYKLLRGYLYNKLLLNGSKLYAAV